MRRTLWRRQKGGLSCWPGCRSSAPAVDLTTLAACLSLASCPYEVRGLLVADVPDTDQARRRIQRRQRRLDSCAQSSRCTSWISTHYCAGDRLHQQPAAELEQLRAQPGTHLPRLPIAAGELAHIPGTSGPLLDISFSLRQGESDRAGLLLRPWLHADSADAQPTAAALIVDWHSQTLQVPQLCFVVVLRVRLICMVFLSEPSPFFGPSVLKMLQHLSQAMGD
jgi:hypothetical protein